MSKTEIITATCTMAASGSMSSKRFVAYSGAICGANAKAIGVSGDDVSDGQIFPVKVSGIVVVKSGAAVTVGDALVSNATGKAIPASTLTATQTGSTIGTGATQVTSSAANGAIITDGSITLAGSKIPQAINGYALDAATGADEDIRVKLV